MNWKNWPYWLKGGVIGGGVALIYALLFYSCPFITSGYNIIGCGAVFYMLGPIYPVGWLLGIIQSIFNYAWILPEFYAPVISVAAWFVVGAFLGALIQYTKSKRNLILSGK